MSAPHLDDRVLASLQEVMEDEYPVLLDTFVLDSEERLRSLHAALQAGDAQALQLQGRQQQHGRGTPRRLLQGAGRKRQAR